MNTLVLVGGSVNRRSILAGAAESTGSQLPMLRSEASAASPFQREAVLFGRIAPGWLVVNPLTLDLEQDEDGTYIYSDEIFAVYGDGPTPEDALEDYIQSLIDYYQILASRFGDLPTRSQLRHLQIYLNPVGN